MSHIAKTDGELAAKLKTHRKSVGKWRREFPADAPATRDVDLWLLFIRDNMLGPFSARMGYGENIAQPRVKRPASELSDSEAQAIVRAVYVDFTLGAAGLAAEAAKFFPSAVEAARVELAAILAACERLYDLAGLVKPPDDDDAPGAR